MKQVLVDVKKCLGCRSCELACAVEHSAGRNLFQAVRESPRPRRRIYVESVGKEAVPINCRHCDNSPCVAVCITRAMSKDQVTGIVSHDSKKCVSCLMCVMACPFGVITTTGQRDLVVKCDRCPGLSRPACVQSCPTGALVFQEVEEFSQSVRKQFLTEFIREEGCNL